ncbi:MAG: NAD(P)-dependent dehydrogenase (short-subunit alcohol dehydrogenase family), partial [Myxococcota bacterium]
GRALVDAIANAGANVLVHARTQASLDPVLAALQPHGASVAGVVGDLQDTALGKRIADAAEAAFGGLDVAVFNAGMLGPMAPLTAAETVAALSHVLDVNVTAQLRIFEGLAPTLLAGERPGVIWLTSGLGRFALPNYGAYCVSKHGLEALNKMVAVEFEAAGLTSVAVAPGMVATEMLQAALGGADVSGHTPAPAAAAGFVRLITGLDASLSGQSIDLEPYL